MQTLTSNKEDATGTPLRTDLAARWTPSKIGIRLDECT